MTTGIVSPPMRRKAEQLAELLLTFNRGTSKVTGERFYVVPASNRMTAHWTALDGSGCTCIGYQRRGTCTHAIAAKMLHTAKRPAFAKLADLTGGCAATGCPDDREGREPYCSRHILVDAF